MMSNCCSFLYVWLGPLFLGWALSISFLLVARPLKVDVKAGSAVLMNADTGALLYEKQPVIPVYPASTTKIATALFILAEKKPDFDQKLRVSAESLRRRPLYKQGECPPYWWYSDGTHMGLREGEMVSTDALLHGMMMISGNDAANVMAEGFSGSVPVFIEEMNQYLAKIGCNATRFLNPHGCHHPDHVTTAYDLCVMTREALQIPKFRELVSTLSYIRPKTNKQGPGELKQSNPLLKPGRFYYSKAIGVKTGFHLAAQYTLVAAAVNEGRSLIAAVIGTQSAADRYADAIRLFEAAFAETKEIRRFFGPENVFSRRVPDATTELTASLAQDLLISYFPAEEPVVRAFVYWETPHLPIRKGQSVGEVCIVDAQGEVLAKGALLANREVKGTPLFVLKKAFNAMCDFFDDRLRQAL